MGLTLSIILLLLGYAWLDHTLAKSVTDRRSKWVLAVLLLFIYGGMAALLLVVLGMLGLLDNGSLVITVSAGLVSLVGVGVFLSRHGQSLSLPVLGLLAVYLVGLIVLCVFSRIGEVQTDVNGNAFLSFRQAISQGSLAPLTHFFLNMLLFVPIGVLVPLSCKGYPFRLYHVVLPAVLLSTGIECVQLFFRLGTCDIEDIIANVLGALLGFALLKGFVRMES